MRLPPEQLEARARQLRLLLLDVDGVLTDGTISVTGTGAERKTFHIRDGAAIVWAQRAGLAIGLLSGRESSATTHRAAELKITTVIQGQVDKRAGFQQIVAAHGLEASQIGYMGDDLLDLPVLAMAGLSAAPADACDDVRRRVHYVTTAKGGRGAVRELIELILKGRGQWDAIVDQHLGERT